MRPTYCKTILSAWASVVLTLVMVVINGCSLVPDYQRPEAPFPQLKQTDDAHAGTSDKPVLTDQEASLLVSLDRSGQLQALVEKALHHNRDYQIGTLRVDQARAEYGVLKAERLPVIEATGHMQRQAFNKRSLNDAYGQRYSAATLGISDFELDFFGRLNALSEASRHEYLATTLGQQAARKALLLEVAQRFLTLRAVGQRQGTATALLKHHRQQLSSAEQQFQSGEISEEQLKDLRAVAIHAQQQVEDQNVRFAKARNSLEHGVGYSVSVDVSRLDSAPLDAAHLSASWFADLSSNQLLKRYDVLAAEQQLKAANAYVGAARAAFFPTIRLSTAGGLASRNLGDLFAHGTGTWLFVPQITLPIFDGGRNQANLDIAQARKQISVAQYEQTIQNAFRDMADAFSEREALILRVRSQSELNELAQEVMLRRQGQLLRGDITQLDELAAQIQAVQTKQALMDTHFAIQMNLLSLYRALNGADATAISS